MYSHNATINDLVLTIVNDGDGDQCGMTYAQRCAAAENGLFELRAAVRHYNRYRHSQYRAPLASREEVIEAADILQRYYREHMAERQS